MILKKVGCHVLQAKAIQADSMVNSEQLHVELRRLQVSIDSPG